MTVDTRPTPWDSPLDILLAVNELVHEQASTDHCQRAINFMAYELNSSPADLPLETRLTQLNDMFFGAKGFRTAMEPYALQSMLQKREGAPICLALLYLHLAHSIGLKLQLVHWPLHAVLRWSTDNKCYFIDLDQQGQILSEEELLALIQRHSDQVRTLSMSEANMQYLAYVIIGLRQKRELNKTLKLLDIVMACEPENMRYLSERALLKKELGLYKEAIADFKRYFAFVDPSDAPAEIASGYSELCNAGPTL